MCKTHDVQDIQNSNTKSQTHTSDSSGIISDIENNAADAGTNNYNSYDDYDNDEDSGYMSSGIHNHTVFKHHDNVKKTDKNLWERLKDWFNRFEDDFMEYAILLTILGVFLTVVTVCLIPCLAVYKVIPTAVEPVTVMSVSPYSYCDDNQTCEVDYQLALKDKPGVVFIYNYSPQNFLTKPVPRIGDTVYIQYITANIPFFHNSITQFHIP